MKSNFLAINFLAIVGFALLSGGCASPAGMAFRALDGGGSASQIPSKLVPREDAKRSVYVYPMHKGTIRPLAEVSRIQCNSGTVVAQLDKEKPVASAFITRIDGVRTGPNTGETMASLPVYMARFWILDGGIVAVRKAKQESLPEYCEVEPGNHVLSGEFAYDGEFGVGGPYEVESGGNFAFRLHTRPGAWYDHRCVVEQTKAGKGKYNVRVVEFNIYEVYEGKRRLVTTLGDLTRTNSKLSVGPRNSQ